MKTCHCSNTFLPLSLFEVKLYWKYPVEGIYLPDTRLTLIYDRSKSKKSKNYNSQNTYHQKSLQTDLLIVDVHSVSAHPRRMLQVL